MKKIDIIRAWKDEDYRDSLTAEAARQLARQPGRHDRAQPTPTWAT